MRFGLPSISRSHIYHHPIRFFQDDWKLILHQRAGASPIQFSLLKFMKSAVSAGALKPFRLVDWTDPFI
jgi:hypothetical protein